MDPQIELVQAVLPLAYMLSSVLFILYLSRKPVHLDKYTILGSKYAPPSDLTSGHQDHARHQAIRASGMSINLARVCLTVLRLAFIAFSIALYFNDNARKENPERRDTLLHYYAQAIAWSYAIVLSFLHLVWPTTAAQFKIRPQLDLFYILELAHSSVHLSLSDILTLPLSDWSLLLKIHTAAWIVTTTLIWVSLVTVPYHPAPPSEKLRQGEVERRVSKEYASSLYSRLTFSWMNSLIYLGFKRPVNDVDLPNLEKEDASQYRADAFKTIKRPTFKSAFIRAIRRDMIIQFMWGLPYCILVNASPFLLNKIIKYIECRECGAPSLENYGHILGLLLASVFQSLCQQTCLHSGRRMYIHAVSICNSEVFAKTLRRKDMSAPVNKKADSDNSDAKGKTMNISNLVAVDIKQLENPLCYLHDVYSFPIQFFMAAIQLYWLLGKASLVGLGFMVVSYPIPAVAFSLVMRLFRQVMESKDDRMEILNEMLSAIRIVKFFGWESKFVEKITISRESELQRTKESFTQIVLAGVIWKLMPLVNIVVVLVSYTMWFGQEISASVLFTTLALFNILRPVLDNIPWTITDLMRAFVSLDRIDTFLKEEELVKNTTVTNIDGKARVQSSSNPVIGFVNASYTWPIKEQEQAAASRPASKPAKKSTWIQKIKAKFSKAPASVEEPVEEPVEDTTAIESEAVIQERFKLKNISAEFPVGQLSLVVGPTGCGKSALLLALLGELEKLEGAMYLPRLDYGSDSSQDRGSGIAYVSQTAWLQNTTIRENILFGKEFDQDRYDAVVEGCALVTDFEILESGDKTEIGEQGITLSGGQKQRVSLARAIYSDAKVLLLDDCLSAVDTHTGKHLFQTLTGPLLYGRTIIMATHQVQLTLNAASFVVVLDKGEVIGTGLPDDAIHRGWINHVKFVEPASDQCSGLGTLDREGRIKVKKGFHEKIQVKLIEDEKKIEGSVAWRVYTIYLKASGGRHFWPVLVALFLIREALDVGQNGWLAIWGNKMASTAGNLIPSILQTSDPGSGKVSVGFYLGGYIFVNAVFMGFSVLADYFAIFGNIEGSRTLHARLLKSVSRAKVRFFDTVPIGRVINRFSADMATVDEQVLRELMSFMNAAIVLAGIIAIISINTPTFLIIAVFIVAVYGAIGMLYIPISRDLKRMNSNSRSPILNHFNETMVGLATIRAYGFQARFLSRNIVNIDDNNRTFFLLWSTNRWLHWRVDLTGALVAFTTGMLVLQNKDTLEPGWAAMSLTYSLMFTTTIVWLIRVYAENEMNMNAVERIEEYMNLEQEPPAIIEDSRPPASWPHSGEIIVDHLTMKYAPDTPEVIKDISFKIKAGEKVGVVGRSGSGKSTLAISLFRFMDPVKGTISIDGIDICKIGLQDLRSKMTIIPQDPILFKGSLRFNLDPFGEHEDRDLWEALRRSHLIPEAISVASSVGPSVDPADESSAEQDEIADPSKITLDTVVRVNGSNFSQGQRQLIALARALVRRSKIIVMDEATASVDFETDLKIQTTIREEMTDATIITIAHRIRTIADFDRVLVMDAGEVAEFDKPYTLMRKKDSLFRSMCERSSDFGALLAIAEGKAQRGC
ncbi:hypothetical protein BGX28_008950 [Mortierella sp. GBA30]|nr:hypothetical protein BGX28_008950 [Mortierella sp. GBA30]